MSGVVLMNSLNSSSVPWSHRSRANAIDEWKTSGTSPAATPARYFLIMSPHGTYSTSSVTQGLVFENVRMCSSHAWKGSPMDGAHQLCITMVTLSRCGVCSGTVTVTIFSWTTATSLTTSTTCVSPQPASAATTAPEPATSPSAFNALRRETFLSVMIYLRDLDPRSSVLITPEY